jgi:hypothetical protein
VVPQNLYALGGILQVRVDVEECFNKLAKQAQ